LLSGFFGGNVLYAIEATIGTKECSYIDALFVSVSAVCVTGLSSAPFANFHTGSQVFLLFLMVGGGGVFMTIVPLIVRRYFYRKLYRDAEVPSAHFFLVRVISFLTIFALVSDAQKAQT